MEGVGRQVYVGVRGAMARGQGPGPLSLVLSLHPPLYTLVECSSSFCLERPRGAPS